MILAASFAKIAGEVGFLVVLVVYVALAGRLFGSSPRRDRRYR